MKRIDQNVLQTAAGTVSSLGTELSNTVGAARELGTAGMRYADRSVHRQPWRAIGVAAGVGVLIGLLMRRR